METLTKVVTVWNQNELTKTLKIDYPIVQGPFGGGLSTVELVAAVSNAGGLGSYGAHIIPPDTMKTLVEKIKNSTSKPFAVNLWVSTYDADGKEFSHDNYQRFAEAFKPFYQQFHLELPDFPRQFYQSFDEQVDALIDAAPPVISFVFGIPNSNIIAACRRKNITTIAAATTVEEAIAIEQAGIDIVLATGLEAGGHRVSFLKSAESSLTGGLALIPTVADQISVPFIAAGGIADARGIRAAMSLGAHGVQIGTAFLACAESGASDMHRSILFSDRAKNTVLSRAFTGRLARFIPNQFISSVEQQDSLPLPFPIQSYFTAPLKKAADGAANSEYASLYAGQSASLLKHRNAEVLMQYLINDMNDFFQV